MTLSAGRRIVATVTTAPLLTTRDVARLLSLDERTVANWAASGRLPALRLPGGTQWRFRQADIDRILTGPAA